MGHGMPCRAGCRAGVLGDPAATDEVNRRMQVQLLSPGVQHGEHGHGAADVTGIAGEFDDRRGDRLTSIGITVALMSTQYLAQLGVGTVTVT